MPLTPLSLGRQTVQESPKVVVLMIAGDVDYLNVPGVESYFDELLLQEEPRHLLLDLTGLTFLVTPFLGSLLFWKEALGKRGGKFVVFGMNRLVEPTMRVMRLSRVLTLCPDREAALAVLSRD